MAQAVDISIVGDKSLERRFNKIASEKTQKRIARLALRKSAKRLKWKVLVKLAEHDKTGRLSSAVEAHQVATWSFKGLIGSGIPLPSREELGQSPKTKVLYPYFLEYGNLRQQGFFPFQTAVSEARDAEIAMIGRDIGAAIERAAAKGKA